MRAYLKAILIASTATACGSIALGQSSSPFSGLFGGGSEAEGPVSLEFRIAGGDEALEKSLRNTSLVASALNDGRTTGQDVLAAARGDYARILGTLYDMGHYSAVIYITLDGVEAAEIAPISPPAQVAKVLVTVDPGPQFRFSRAAISPVAKGSEIPSEYATGEPAGTGVIKSAALSGVEGWRSAGHAKADVGGQQIVADHNQNRVDSQIALAPGPVVTFGKLNITGENGRMDPRRLRKITGFPAGTTFDPDELESMRRRLRRTEVFSAITLEESEDLGPGNTMDVNLTVIEQKPRRIGFGGEITNNDGAAITAYWIHRNLFGGAERLLIEGELTDIGSKSSERDEELTVRIDRPATLTPDTAAYVEATASREREEDYDADTASIALGFNHYFSEELNYDIAVEYQFSRVNDADEFTDFETLALPMDVTWDKRDDPTDAKRGYFLSAEGGPFMGFNDTGSGARILGEGRAYYSLGEDDRFTLAGRARAGTVLGSELADTPRDYLFFSGGGGTVRGQAYESLGVREIIGRDGPIKTGGMSIVNASAEIRFQVREKIGLVAFADYGQVWDDSSWSGVSYWQAGAGAGVRYKTPIGPLRFDIAGPLGNGDTNDGVQLYLGLGQAF